MERVLQTVERKCSAVMANRIDKIAAEFATVDAFLNASKGELMSKWTKLNPETNRGLGDGFFEAFDVFLHEWRDRPETPERPDSLGERAVTQELLLWMADFLDRNKVPQMKLGRLLSVYDAMVEAKGEAGA